MLTPLKYYFSLSIVYSSSKPLILIKLQRLTSNSKISNFWFHRVRLLPVQQFHLKISWQDELGRLLPQLSQLSQLSESPILQFEIPL